MRRISNCSVPQNYSCIKGLVYRLSHDCNFDIDRDVSTAHCRSSSGDGVDLVSPQYGPIFATVVVSDWCINNLALGRWVLIQSIVSFTDHERGS